MRARSASVNFNLIDVVVITEKRQAGSGAGNFPDDASGAIDESITEIYVDVSADVMIARGQY